LENKLRFDLIVIGTGTAGSTAASQCRSKGWSVAIIDSLSFGGTCALRGCEPKKVLQEAAKLIDSSKRHESKGIKESTGMHIQWNELIEFKRTFTDSFPIEREKSYNKKGISAFHGNARFIGQNEVVVENSNNDNKDHSSDSDHQHDKFLYGNNILIATGARPRTLNFSGSEYIHTSDQFLEYCKDKLPSKIVFIGGGYISFEFAHIAAKAGSKVTILQRGKNPLKHFDPDLVNLLLEKSKKMGIDVKLQTEVKKIDKLQFSYKNYDDSNDNFNSNTRLLVQFSPLSSSEDKNSKTTSSTLEVDMVVHGAGRIPNVEHLDLEKGGIQYTEKGIKVNEYLQSVSNSAIYAAGDVSDSGGLPLSPVASYEGNIVASNLLEGNNTTANYLGLPSVVFTLPAIASVGLNEKKAKEQGLRFRVNYQNTAEWYSSRRVGEACSGFKVLIEENSDRILGAHLIGPHAEEVINIFAMAINLGLTTKDLNNPLLYSYPTNSSDIIYML
jgi:glutathione reductase (NADPH)